MALYTDKPKKCCNECHEYNPCGKCECIELPIKGSDVIYRGIHLELLNIQNGDDYHKVISKINKYLETLDTEESVKLSFRNIGGGYEIFQKVNTDKEVLFKTIKTDDTIDIIDYGEYLYIKTTEKLKIFQTLSEAQDFANSTNSTEGHFIYVVSENKYFKVSANKTLVDPFDNKLNKPNELGSEREYPYIILIDDSGNSVKKLYSEVNGGNASINTLIIAGEGLTGGGSLQNDVILSLSNETIIKINKGVMGYDHSIDMGDAKTQVPDWSTILTNQLIF